MDNKLAIRNRNQNSIEIIDIAGFLDAHTAPMLESAIKDLFDNEKYKIIINFGGLEYISSAGLGVFMSFIEDIRSFSGDIKLTNMQPKVFSVFDLLGFPMLFDITKEESEAIDKFSQVNNTNE